MTRLIHFTLSEALQRSNLRNQQHTNECDIVWIDTGLAHSNGCTRQMCNMFYTVSGIHKPDKLLIRHIVNLAQQLGEDLFYNTFLECLLDRSNYLFHQELSDTLYFLPSASAPLTLDTCSIQMFAFFSSLYQLHFLNCVQN